MAFQSIWYFTDLPEKIIDIIEEDVAQNFDHKSLWDAEWLMHNLKKAGFLNCKEYSFNEGELKDLIIDRDGRQIESIYIEAKK